MVIDVINSIMELIKKLHQKQTSFSLVEPHPLSTILWITVLLIKQSIFLWRNLVLSYAIIVLIKKSIKSNTIFSGGTSTSIHDFVP